DLARAIVDQLIVNFKREPYAIAAHVIAAERLGRISFLHLPANSLAAGLSLVLGNKVPDVPVQDFVGRDAKQVALGLVHTADHAVAVDLVVRDGRFLEQGTEAALAFAQPVVRALLRRDIPDDRESGYHPATFVSQRRIVRLREAA